MLSTSRSVVHFGTICDSSAVIWEMDSESKVPVERIFAKSEMAPKLLQSTNQLTHFGFQFL